MAVGRIDADGVHIIRKRIGRTRIGFSTETHGLEDETQKGEMLRQILRSLALQTPGKSPSCPSRSVMI